MNFREEQKQRTEQIEQILRRFLPEAKGEAAPDHGSDGVQSACRRKAAPSDVDVGDVLFVWRERIGCGTVHGCDGDDPHIFTRT